MKNKDKKAKKYIVLKHKDVKVIINSNTGAVFEFENQENKK